MSVIWYLGFWLRSLRTPGFSESSSSEFGFVFCGDCDRDLARDCRGLEFDVGRDWSFSSQGVIRSRRLASEYGDTGAGMTRSHIIDSVSASLARGSAEEDGEEGYDART